MLLGRPSIVRVCIEIDLLQKFPSRIWIGCGNSGFWQQVSYENVPKYCTVCLKLGHGHSECKIEAIENGVKIASKGKTQVQEPNEK